MLEIDENRDPLEVLAEDYMERRRRGESPSIAEYVARRPDLAADIEELFPTVDVVERLKVHKEQGSGSRVSLGGARPESLGDFRILSEIGRGGMGIVYEAFQQSLGRHVAVKVLPSQSMLAPQQLQRFQREARTAARLHHTNIVPVFGVGEHEGVHYIVMQLIRGQGLDTVLDNLRQTVGGGADAQNKPDSAAVSPRFGRRSEVLRLAKALVEGEFSSASFVTEVFSTDQDTEVNGCPDTTPDIPVAVPTCRKPWQVGPTYWRNVAGAGRQVAEALDYAHAQHTLHRDIKPANLLLDSQGVMWITDFGLAKAMDQDNVTQTGGMAGTLRYMAPEQFSGRCDARSDIYSLGLTLYEMLTLRPAFVDGNRSSLIANITQGEPPRPRRLDPQIPRDLETIVLKAIAREPGDRYQKAGDLAHDLECFLEDRPIQARRVSSAERLWRWARRNRAVASLAASTLLLLVVVAVVASVGYVRTARAHTKVQRANTQEKLQRKKAEETSALAIEALDSMFEQFAPDRTAPASAALVVDADETIAVPIQPVLSKEAAAMLEHMLAFYDRLAAQGGSDAHLRRKTAEANRRVGDIRQRLGHYEQAKTAYVKAIDLYSQIAESPDDKDETELRIEIARIHNELGNVYRATNQAEAGRKSHQEALATLQAAAAESAASPRCRYELARTYHLLAKWRGGPPGPPPAVRDGPREHHGGPPSFVFDPRGPHHGPRAPFPLMPAQEGEERLDRALELWQRLVEDDSDWPSPDPSASQERRPSRPRPQPDSSPPWPRGDRNENETYRQRAVDLLERLVADYPTVPDYRHLLARCYRETPPRPDFAANSEPESLYKAAQILEKLVEEHPGVADYRYDLSETYAMLGGRAPRQPEAPDADDAERSPTMLDKALTISEQLVTEHPNIPEYAVSSVNIRLRLNHDLRESDPTRAEANLRKALDLQSTLARRFPDNHSYTFWMAVIQESLGGLLKEEGRLSEAQSALEDCIASFREVMQKDVNARHIRGILAKNYQTLADVLYQMGEEQAFQEASREAWDLRQER